MISMSAVNSIRQQRKGKLIHHKRRLEPTRLTPLRPLRLIDRLINLSYHLLHRMKRMNRFAEREVAPMMASLAKNIANTRRAAGITQEELAEKVGVSRQTVSD